jgi:hypothetical protein
MSDSQKRVYIRISRIDKNLTALVMEATILSPHFHNVMVPVSFTDHDDQDLLFGKICGGLITSGLKMAQYLSEMEISKEPSQSGFNESYVPVLGLYCIMGKSSEDSDCVLVQKYEEGYYEIYIFTDMPEDQVEQFIKLAEGYGWSTEIDDSEDDQ